MSKGLRNMTQQEKKEAVARRIASQSRGLGYWAAIDYSKRKEKGTVKN